MRVFLRIFLPALLISASLVVFQNTYLGSIPLTSVKISEPENDEILPAMGEFIDQVKTGVTDQVTGIYVEGVLAFPVTQQPSDQPAYVSLADHELTQFGIATTYGSLGFLAHNTLAGSEFSNLELDMLIYVIYGDGHINIYKITEIRRFQATTPYSPFSSFVDLSNLATLSTTELFTQTYMTKGSVILQTCIASNEIQSWGRLFIIATPFILEPPF